MDEYLGEVVIYETSGSNTSVEVRLGRETVWLTQQQIAELFDRNKSVISCHLHNIFTSGELQRDSVVAKYATTAVDRSDGSDGSDRF